MFTHNLLPPLWIGITFARSQSVGRVEVCRDAVKILWIKGVTCFALHLRIVLEMLSGPGDFLTSICRSRFRIPGSMNSIGVIISSDVEAIFCSLNVVVCKNRLKIHIQGCV